MYFYESHTNCVSGPFLFDTFGYPGDGAQRPEDASYDGTARYKEYFSYFGVDATFNRLTFDRCNEYFSFLFGAHFAYLNVKERSASDGISFDSGGVMSTVANRFSRKSHFWGLGPQFGLDYRYFLPIDQMCGSWSLRANARTSLLASYNWADLHYQTSQTGPVGVNLENQPSWRINPCADVKVGLAYGCTGPCLRLSFELGYEFIWYNNAVNSITGYDVAFAGNSLDLYSNFNLQGPYFSVGVMF